MNDEQYLTHAKEQFKEFSRTLVSRTDALEATDSLRELAMSFDSVAKGEDDLYVRAPALVERLFTTYPDFAPTFPRELLWFLGGQCLHYMPDDEISLYQQLDDMRDTAQNNGKVLDFQAARAKLMKSK